MAKRDAAALFLISILMMPVAVFVSTNLIEESVITSKVRSFTTSQYQTSAPINISGNSELASVAASGIGTRSDPYIIENLSITSSGTSISVRNTNAYFIIYNCILESGHSQPAIQFDNVENGQIILTGISKGLTTSTSGIQISNSQDISVSNTSIYGSWNGIHLYRVSNSTITNSKLFSNYRGLLFESSSYCQVVNNSIFSNSNNGLEIWGSSHNITVYGNSIGWNGQPTWEFESNAVDDGDDNHFDDGVSVGNTWSDFNGTTPYSIVGSGGAIDSYPELLEDTENPVISGPLDTVIDVETSGNTLNWTTFDEFPQDYSLQIDNGAVAEGRAWNGGDITIDIDSLPVGTYSYLLTFYDCAGNSASDEVVVTVVSFVLGGIGTELVMIASGVTVACFVVIILLVKRLS
ncbi:MAG: hypothetical protein E3J86_08300 [Candidatus Thorarchaeota archaeon]|nr:MAG: hypothetical protein E3J86_08300 [Candidatus Thorarchaeota archaeon]